MECRGRERLLPVVKSRSSVIFLTGAVLLCSTLVRRTAWGQEGGSDVKVNVGIAAAKPGDPIDIPVTLSGTEGVQVGGVVGHISFPKATLSYTEVERGLAVDLADGQAQGVLQQDKEDSSLSVLELTLSGKNPIKPGILAYLKFRVSTDAKKGVVPLKVKDMKATKADGGPMQLAQGDDGELTLFALDEEIPVVGCFFFTH